MCRSLKNLALQASGTLTDAYTDLLLLFTPALFPHSVGEMEQFLRATRLTLVMIDLCDVVFKPVLADSDDNFFRGKTQPILDSEPIEDVVSRLDRLQDFFDPSSDNEDSSVLNDDVLDVDLDSLSLTSSTSSSSTNYYQFTYVDP